MDGTDGPLLDDAVFLRHIFDAFPSPVFVVDPDVRVLFYNREASAFLKDEGMALTKRGGEALLCVNSLTIPEGCGSSEACKSCVIRNSVSEASGGDSVRRKHTAMELKEGDEAREVHFLVTASPFRYEGKALTLLVLEDISELVRLRGIIPVCAWCKRVRNDDNYWESVEEYLNTRLDVDFSHGICEECLNREFSELAEG